jgi:aminopeptidase N
MGVMLVFLSIASLESTEAIQPVFYHPPPRFESQPVFAESLHSYDVRHYRLDITLGMDNAGYQCYERVSIKSNVNLLDSFSLDFAGLVCDSIWQNGQPVRFDTLPGYLRVYLNRPVPAGDSTVIDIFFHREPTAPQIGFFFAQPPTVLHAHAMTCGCPRDNHYWFACWDWPGDKAERGCEINITVPDTFQACANGVLDSVTLAAGNKKTWWWRHSYPIATYLMTFSASRFARWDTVVTTAAGDTVPLIYFMWPRDSAATRTGYRLVPDMLLYYSAPNRFGPYPFERFGLVPGYYGFPWGGMEHQTQVMIHPSYIAGGGEATIGHELAHMWWGDMVTHLGYADVWLNEGFASWAECLYMGHLNGRSYFQNYIAGKARQYFSQHRSWDFPIYNPPWSEIYNYGIVYCKGAWILRMLQFVCGDTSWEQPGVFFRAMRVYGDSFRYGTVSTEDFKRIVARETGKELDRFFAQWVYDRGYPRFRLFWAKQAAGDSWDVFIRVVQQNDTNSRSVFATFFPVRLNCINDSVSYNLNIEDAIYMDTLRVGAEPLSITPDPDNWILDSCYVSQVDITEMEKGLGNAFGKELLILPNPGKTALRFQSPGPFPKSIEIYDRTGRLVAELNLRARDFVWNRTDATGRRLSSGVYFVKIQANRDWQLKLVLLD